MKVSVFFDGQNFYRSLQRYDESLRVDYDRLAAWITQAVGGPGAIFAGAHYYVGVSADAPPLVEGFLKGLELRPGYFVKRELRVRRSGRCPACSADYEYTTEKRVDTRLVADIIQYAAIGAFDAAVLVSGDDDFVPAVEAVNSLGKQVWVATGSAEARLPHVSRGYFVMRWKSHQLPPVGADREALVQQMIGAGLAEEFEVKDGEGRSVTAIRSREPNGNVRESDGNIALPG